MDDLKCMQLGEIVTLLVTCVRKRGFPGSAVVKNPPANAGDVRRGCDPRIRKIPWRRARQPTLVFLPG